MFEKIDLSKRMDKEEYEEIVPDLRKKLASLQREASGLGIPSIVVFEGWEASGKGKLINDLILPMDPRGFDVYEISDPGPEEDRRPFFWRFWVKTPSRGRMAIFSRSWYHRTLVEKAAESEAGLRAGPVTEINYFERELAADGFLILKFFLHIGKKEQKKRFEELDSDPSTTWMITDKSWQSHKKYDKYASAIESLIEKTDFNYAPWVIVEAEDRRFAEAKVLAKTVESLERVIAAAQIPRACDIAAGQVHPIPGINSSMLDKVDLSKAYSKRDYEQKLEKCQEAIRKTQYKAYDKKVPTVVLFEGWDAAGKGGAIKRLTQSMDPRCYTVVPIGAPNDYEKAHNYLWRFWRHLPVAGHFTIFDRSWYGRVLVERVENFCAREDWERSYNEINEMEEQLVNSGTVLVKFWLHIDKDEQLKRFQARTDNPDKAWKITEEDWRNREKWDAYKNALDEMLYRTSTTYAPWTIVEANDKNYARIKVLKTVIQAMEMSLE